MPLGGWLSFVPFTRHWRTRLELTLSLFEQMHHALLQAVRAPVQTAENENGGD